MGMGMVPQVQFIVFYIGEADLGGGEVSVTYGIGGVCRQRYPCSSC